jgi:hypothetical protein
MTPQKLGPLIGAVFGLIFVVVNTASVPTGVAVLLRVLGVVAFLAVLVAVRRPSPGVTAPPAGGGFGPGYWLVVAGEVLAIAAGLALLNGPLAAPDAAVAWISFVVGGHFFALAVVWKQSLFHRLGAALMLCGAIGLVLAALGSTASAIDLVGGVLPGATLLGFSLWGSTRRTGAKSAKGNAVSRSSTGRAREGPSLPTSVSSHRRPGSAGAGPPTPESGAGTNRGAHG